MSEPIAQLDMRPLVAEFRRFLDAIVAMLPDPSAVLKSREIGILKFRCSLDETSGRLLVVSHVGDAEHGVECHLIFDADLEAHASSTPLN